MPTASLNDIAPASQPSGRASLADIQPEPDHPSYWHELWQQSGIPGLVEGLKTHPAGTVATALGSLLSVVRPGLTPVPEGNGHISVTAPSQGQQAEDIAARGPAAIGAAATLGAAQTLGPKLAPKVVGAAGRGIESALDTTGTSLAKGALRAGYKTTTNADVVDQAARTFKENSIPFSPEGAQSIQRNIDALQGQKVDLLRDRATEGAVVDREAALDPARELLARKANQVNPTADLRDVNKVIDTFSKTNPREIPVDQAEFLKEGTYKENKYGPSPPPHMAATAQAEKAIAHGLMSELEAQIPEIADINAKQGQQIGLKPIIEAAVTKYRNSGGFKSSIKGAFSGGAAKLIPTAASGAAAAVTHDPWLAAAGPALSLMSAVLNDPVIRTRLASAVYKAQQVNPAKWGQPSMQAAMGRVAGYGSAVGSALERVQAGQTPTE